MSQLPLWKWVGGALAVSVTVLYLSLPDVRPLAVENPATTAFIDYYSNSDSDRIEQTWIPFSQLSSHLKNAVLIAEDDAFLAHDGIDVKQIKRSIKESWDNGKRLRGASTITQQVAKNLYLSPARNPIRKLKEIMIAWRLEAHLSKTRIFEIYLNIIEWGEGVYGAEAASQFYFDKSATALTQWEAAFLAALIPNPTLLTHPRHRKWLHERQSLILRRLQKYPPRF